MVTLFFSLHEWENVHNFNYNPSPSHVMHGTQCTMHGTQCTMQGTLCTCKVHCVHARYTVYMQGTQCTMHGTLCTCMVHMVHMVRKMHLEHILYKYIDVLGYPI